MSAAPEPAASTEAARPEPSHGWRIFWIWLPIALIGDLAIWFLWGPHMPPGDMGSAAASQQFDINVLAIAAWPVMAFVLVFAGYAFIVWRHREGDEEDGPPIYVNRRIATSWIAGSSAIVLAAFVFGTVQLVVPAGAGSGQGNTPIWRPNAKTLVVQVIGQQWRWTYRYPQFGGFETTQLMLPVGRWIQFNVTSIDVIHSFNAYQLGVKADANPQVNNVAFSKTDHTGFVQVRCFELCGLWHSDMITSAHVVSDAAFAAWAANTRVQLAALTKILPPYATTYDPDVVPQLSKAFTSVGLTGAGGGFYGPQDPVQP